MRIDTSKTYLHHLRAMAAERPDARWMSEVGGRSVTFREGYEESLRWADILSSHGIGRGDRIGVFLENCIDGQKAWLGAAWLRALEIPIGPMFRGASLVELLNECRASLLLTNAELLASIEEIADQLKWLKTVIVIGETTAKLPPAITLVDRDAAMAASRAEERFAVPENDEIACVLYTSGTTGRSKGVLIPWGQLVASMYSIDVDAWTSDEVVYYTGASNHQGARVQPIILAAIGGQFVMRPSFKTDAFWDDVDRYGCTYTILVGAMAFYLKSQPERPDDAHHSLKWVSMVPVLPDVEAFNARFGVLTTTAYSMTEICGPLGAPGWRIENAASCGQMRGGWPGFHLRIVDEEDRDVPEGEVGELLVRTDAQHTMCKGYLDRPDATEVAWRGGWFHTGDAFRRDGDGNYFLVDRLKDAIRRSGENISSMEVEAHVRSFPAVQDCAAVAVRADSVEDEIKIFITPQDGQKIDPVALSHHLDKRMPRFMLPRYVAIVDALPKTPTLRIKKAELRTRPHEDCWDRVQAGVLVRAPRT